MFTQHTHTKGFTIHRSYVQKWESVFRSPSFSPNMNLELSEHIVFLKHKAQSLDLPLYFTMFRTSVYDSKVLILGAITPEMVFFSTFSALIFPRTFFKFVTRFFALTTPTFEKTLAI